MVMHKEFADWYRAAAVAPPQDVLEQRWKGVEEATAGLNAAQVSELLRLFAIRPAHGYAAPEFLDTSFRHHDSAFPTRNHIEELRVLAGAILRNAVETEHASSVAAAYGFTCIAFGSRYANLPTREHVKPAEQFLASRATAIRDSTGGNDGKIASMSKERINEVFPATAFPPNQTPALREPLISVLIEQSTTNQSVDKRLNTIWRLVQAQREESNLLWWLQNSFSKDLAVPFTQLSAASSACIFPLELADLTVFIPGPSAILGMIVSAQGKTSGNEESSIHGVVNAAPRGWRESRISQLSGQAVGALSPVLFAMSKSLDTDGEDDWLPSYRKQCEVKVDETYHVRDIAQQVYRERMFIRALSEFGK